jgi:hypothetical protein
LRRWTRVHLFLAHVSGKPHQLVSMYFTLTGAYVGSKHRRLSSLVGVSSIHTSPHHHPSSLMLHPLPPLPPSFSMPPLLYYSSCLISTLFFPSHGSTLPCPSGFGSMFEPICACVFPKAIFYDYTPIFNRMILPSYGMISASGNVLMMDSGEL